MNHAMKCLIIALCAFSIVACQKRAAEAPRPALAPRPAEAPKPAEAPQPASYGQPGAPQKAVQSTRQAAGQATDKDKTAPTERKIIKEGDLVFETSDAGRTNALIRTTVSELKGYIAEESQNKLNDRLETRAVIRVPAGNFDRLVETLSAKTVVIDRKNIKTLDVTEEYIDLEARLRTRKDIENRYRQLLAQAHKVDDVLNVEQHLGEVREQIEVAEGKLKYFNDRIAYSTLTVVYYERTSSPIGFISRVREGVTEGWNNFAMFIVVLVNIWPFILLLAGAVFLFRRMKRRRAAGKADKASGGSAENG